MGKEGEIPKGMSILDASEKLGVELRHDCGGFATCSTCRILVLDGVTSLSEIDLDEENMLEEAELPLPFRLSCQTKVEGDGDIVVRVPEPEMDWTKNALRELDAHPVSCRQVIRFLVEARARQKDIPVILPDTAIPYVKQARKDYDAVEDDPVALVSLIKQACDGSQGEDS